MESVFTIGSLVVWMLAVGTLIWGTRSTLRQFRSPVSGSETPPTSVLKPLKGADPGLADNLRSFFELDYPEFEILFSVADADDPAVAVVRAEMARHPHIDARLVVGAPDIGPNPKVNNLILPYTMAKYDWVLISDSNTRVNPMYLRRLAGQIDSELGVLTSIVAGRGAEGLGGNLEAMYLNTFIARWMRIAFAVRRPFVVGKSMFFRRSTADRFGGMKSLSHYIAEDYRAGEAIRRLGLQVKIAVDPIVQHVGKYSFRAFWSRHVRWGRLRKTAAPLAFLIEPLFNSWVSGALGAFAFRQVAGGYLFVMIHMLTWFVWDLILIHALEGKWRPRGFFVWIVREALAIPLWFHIALGNTVFWRGTHSRLLPGGTVVPLSGRM